jgi:Flp pilus assembly protein TadD
VAEALRLREEARSLQRSGQWVRAEPLYRQALAIQEQLQGPEHPAVAETLNDLGTLFDMWGRPAEAESTHRRALAINEQSLGAAASAYGHES